MQIDQLTFRVSEAARITELPIKTVRAWLDRHSLFPEMRDIGTGHPVKFGIRHLLMLGAVDALSSTGLTVTAACDIVRNSGAWPFGFDAQWLHASRNQDGRWTRTWPPQLVGITINLASVWNDMKDRLVAEIEAKATDGKFSKDFLRICLEELDALDACARDRGTTVAERESAQ